MSDETDLDDALRESGQKAQLAITNFVSTMLAAGAVKLNEYADTKNDILPSFSVFNKRDLSGQAITQDRVLIALHLFSARVATEVMPPVFSVWLKKTRTLVEGWLGALVATLVEVRLPQLAALVSMLVQVYHAVEVAKQQREMEARIRKISAELQKDLRAVALSKKHRVRKSRWVSSRHYTKRKRRYNG